MVSDNKSRVIIVIFTTSKIISHIWDISQVFKNGPSKICGRQPIKNLKGYGLPKANL